jgi:phenylalanyl-tRNA synthetase beta chain
MDAMSHIGVARDICAFLSHHGNKDLRLKQPDAPNFQASGTGIPIIVTIQNIIACQRYSGLVIDNVRIEPSPSWMQDKLKAIGVRPINNIVDITNYVLHETGQPLHAFDAQEIIGNQIIIRNLPEGTPFRTLDEKDRKLSIEDLMICNAESGMCIAGVFGGLESGIKSTTTRIFLESAWFNPIDIRKTSFRHGLRTDAATHFEKGMDISNTVFALKRTAALILELKAGEIASEIIDVYPHPKPMTVIVLKYHYLNKLSGKNYHPDSVKNILQSLGFGIIKEGLDDLHISVPYHKPDITLPADVVEEVMRIDGLDNIPIPGSITISPSVEPDHASSSFREKVSDYLVGLGFQEIFTNSITSSAYYEEAELKGSVHMINNLSADLDILRPCMLETGLETLSYNLNRKMGDLRFFDFGKTYQSNQVGVYSEKNHFTLYITGALSEESWKRKPEPADIYYLKGVCERVALLLSPVPLFFERSDKKSLEPALTGKLQNLSLLHFGSVSASVLKRFDIRQPVYFADFDWDLLLSVAGPGIEFREIPKQLPVIRDLAIVVDKGLSYQKVELTIRGNGLSRLRNTRLFDVFENPRLGENKKSLAISFSFWDEDKTLTDEEVDSMMQKIMQSFEKELSAEIRK